MNILAVQLACGSSAERSFAAASPHHPRTGGGDSDWKGQMLKMLWILVGTIALATTSAAREGDTVESPRQADSAMVKNNRQIVEAFLDLINRHRRVREAFERYVSENYVQHNPTAGDGREDAIRLIEGLAATPGFNPMVKRIVAEGDLVAVHMHVQLGDGPGLAVMDMFRLDKGKIVEHWDVIQEVPKQTRSGNSMF